MHATKVRQQITVNPSVVLVIKDTLVIRRHTNLSFYVGFATKDPPVQYMPLKAMHCGMVTISSLVFGCMGVYSVR